MSHWIHKGLLAATMVVASALPGVAAASTEIVAWQNVPALTGSGKPATAEQIKRAFTIGGARRGWSCVDEGPDRLACTVVVRTHTLVMNLIYEPGKYSLTYKSSINLDYRDQDGKKTIHRSYVSWNTNLMNDARAEMLQLP